MKQNITDLIDNFCIHLSEPSRIQTRKKEVPTEPRYNVMVVSDWKMQKRSYTITNEQ